MIAISCAITPTSPTRLSARKLLITPMLLKFVLPIPELIQEPEQILLNLIAEQNVEQFPGTKSKIFRQNPLQIFEDPEQNKKHWSTRRTWWWMLWSTSRSSEWFRNFPECICTLVSFIQTFSEASEIQKCGKFYTITLEKVNTVWPEQVIIYRDGVSSTQLEACHKDEIQPIGTFFVKIESDSSLSKPSRRFFNKWHGSCVCGLQWMRKYY